MLIHNAIVLYKSREAVLYTSYGINAEYFINSKGLYSKKFGCIIQGFKCYKYDSLHAVEYHIWY